MEKFWMVLEYWQVIVLAFVLGVVSMNKKVIDGYFNREGN